MAGQSSQQQREGAVIMETEDKKPHQNCSCSRNRKCAFHAGQIKQMQRVARPVIDAQKVTVGIEELRARYAKPEAEQVHTRPAAPRRRQQPSRWSK